tara:strand:- start:9752 stop:10009 length:258 start_codon:yes stop_codon:yes gene_type:complete
MKKEKKERPEKGRKDFVEIEIKEKPYKIHRGNQKVSEIKKVGGINLDYILIQIINDKLVHLPNDGSVTIKGGEIFDCQPPHGDNS